MNKTRVKAIILPAVASLAVIFSSFPQTGHSEPAAQAFRRYVCDGRYFSANIPAAWQRDEAISFRRTLDQYGVTLKGPSNANGAPVTITLMYYGKAHKRFKTADKYITLNSRPDATAKIKGEKYGKVSYITLAGQKARTFDLKTYDFIPPYAVSPVKVTFYEKQYVLPARAGGFYALVYRAPMDIARESLQIYESVAKSFVPAK